jgi:hypothetical protein
MKRKNLVHITQFKNLPWKRVLLFFAFFSMLPFATQCSYDLGFPAVALTDADAGSFLPLGLAINILCIAFFSYCFLYFCKKYWPDSSFRFASYSVIVYLIPSFLLIVITAMHGAIPESVLGLVLISAAYLALPWLWAADLLQATGSLSVPWNYLFPLKEDITQRISFAIFLVLLFFVIFFIHRLFKKILKPRNKPMLR